MYTYEKKPNKGVLTVYVILSSLSALAFAAALAADIAGFTVLYAKGSPSKIVRHVILFIASLILISVPAFMKTFRFGIPPAPQILFMGFVFFHFIAGDMLRMYDHPVIWGLKTRIFDKLVHVLTGALFFMIGLSLASLLDKGKNIFGLSPFWTALFAVCFSFAAGCLWEYIEFFCDALSSSNMQRWQDGFTVVITEGEIRLAEFYGQSCGLIDTMGDLLAGAAGAFAAAAPAYLRLKNKSGNIYKMLITKGR